MDKTKSMVFAALFFAIGMILPLLTSQIKEIGDSLLPMHLAVMLCGFVCGAKYGLAVGLFLPFARSVVFGMPPIYPNAVWMSAELAAYGFLTGFLYFRFYNKKTWWLYCCLIASMIFGRIVWGITKAWLMGLAGEKFAFAAFISGGVVDAIPGIIIQLILIPIIVSAINRRE